MRGTLGVLLLPPALVALNAWHATGWTPLAFVTAALAFTGFHLIETAADARRDQPPVQITVQKEWGA